MLVITVVPPDGTSLSGVVDMFSLVQVPSDPTVTYLIVPPGQVEWIPNVLKSLDHLTGEVVSLIPTRSHYRSNPMDFFGDWSFQEKMSHYDSFEFYARYKLSYRYVLSYRALLTMLARRAPRIVSRFPRSQALGAKVVPKKERNPMYDPEMWNDRESRYATTHPEFKPNF